MNRPRCHEGTTTMAERFNAYRIHQRDGGVAARYEVLSLDDLSPGNVVVAVSHSGVNYKDALAATGAGKILRRFPLVGGIDLAGRVVVSDDPRFRPGDEVLATGCGLAETHDGGYAEVARLPGDWLVPLPPAFDGHDAMALGTAGFTAALAIHRLEQNGLEPGAGPVAVTGASGGVGSLAIDILAARGHHVVAVTGKDTVTDHLRSLGAAEILPRGAIEDGGRPLEKSRFAAAIDNVGGAMAAWLTRTVAPGGSIAAVGMAGGTDLHTTVMPFIIRGVNLLGIASAQTPRATRLMVWQRLGGDLRPRHLARIVTQTIPFADLPTAFAPLLAGNFVGRTVVRIGAERIGGDRR